MAANYQNEMLDIRLLGKEYSIACKSEERESLIEAVRYLEDKLDELARRTSASGEKLSLMTALNIAHELLQSQNAEGFDIGNVKRRIGTVNRKLDEVLAQQEKLF